MVLYTHNPSIHKAKAGGSEFKVTLGYIVKFYLKRRTKPGTVVHTFSPSTREEEAGRSLWFQGNLVSSRPAREVRPCLKTETKQGKYNESAVSLG